MPTFLYPLPWMLVAGLIALPLIIHLINMMRHRRIQWAAMEFLLQSQKRNRTWVMLKQLLLLLLRMAAVAAVALMVTQPVLRNELGSLFGGSKTHHIVLLDDSFSMTDRWADTSAFQEAVRVIERLGRQAAEQPTRQEFTLLRFSQARSGGGGTRFDMINEPVDTRFKTALEEKLQSLRASELAVDGSEALGAVERLVREAADTTSLVYIVSDFRKRDWENPGDLRQRLADLAEAGASVQLVDCVDTARPNLAITALQPSLGTRAAGVALRMEVTVANFGEQPARQVTVQLAEDGHPRPALVIDEIGPGQTQTRTFEVLYPQAGQHLISAQLVPDAVAIDNHRYCVVDFPPAVPVLIVDADPKAASLLDGDAYFLSTALSPDGPTPTGIRPQIETPRYLREKPLSGFHAIYLLNVERLEASELAALEQYVAAGGGLGIFVGDRTRADWINQHLYRNGQGLFPAPLVAPTPLLVATVEKTPDLQISDHPIFARFFGRRNPFIDLVNVNRYFAVEKGWSPPEDSTVRIIATLRNRAPLIVEQKFGEGTVVAFLTTAAPRWNNWAQNNPSYVVTIQELQSHLASSRHADSSRQVGTPWELTVDSQHYLPQARFVTPQVGLAGDVVVDGEAIDDGRLRFVLPEADTSGVYEVHLTRGDGAIEQRAVAYNVLAEEGDLKIVDQGHVADRLAGVRHKYLRADQVYFDPKDVAGFNLSETVLYLLIAMLLGEQLLAYSASYHPKKGAAG